MKKITLITIILSVFVVANAQVDKNKILERLKLELLPQTDDYNPYQYARERYLLDALDVRISYEIHDNCEAVKTEIEKFYEVDSIGIEGYRNAYFKSIYLFQCQDAYEFLKNQTNNSPYETIRCEAIINLAWSLNSENIPCITEYAKRDSLSTREKLALAEAYTIYGIYTSFSNFKEEAIKLLDKVCYNFKSDEIIDRGCTWSYYKLGGKSAIDYFTSLLERLEGHRRIAVAAHRLAPLGVYDITFPIFVEAILSEKINHILEAIDGLKVIGTEEAFQLIGELSHSKDEKIAKKASEIVKKLNIERKEK
jgi:hypothetical protein